MKKRKWERGNDQEDSQDAFKMEEKRAAKENFTKDVNVLKRM